MYFDCKLLYLVTQKSRYSYIVLSAVNMLYLLKLLFNITNLIFGLIIFFIGGNHVNFELLFKNIVDKQ